MGYSPGPWTDDVTEDGTLIVSFGDQCGAYSRDIEFGDMENTEGEDHANARLIAMAPELLDALRGMVELHSCFDFPCDAPPCVRARDAIAKAQGR